MPHCSCWPAARWDRTTSGPPPPAAYKEAALPASEAGSWKTAEPAEQALRGEWWKLFGDEGLNQLQEEALRANQNLQAAAARLTQARALQREARAAFFPSLDAAFGPSRQRPRRCRAASPDGTPTSPSTTWRAQASVAYEADLFGRVSSTADAATADAQQSEALYRSVLLALQADVATTYFLVREQDAEAQLYRQTVQLRTEALQLIQRRYDAGDISELDGARRPSWRRRSPRRWASPPRRRRTRAGRAAGRAPSDFAMPPQPLQKVAVSVPAGLPSTLLERRPDIAAAERAMAAANARGRRQVGVLPAPGHHRRVRLRVVGAGQSVPVVQPHVPAGSAGGRGAVDADLRRRAAARSGRARAVYEEDVALYRQTVLNAFREVEDNLANLRILADQTRAQDAAVASAARAAKLSHSTGRGRSTYLDVIEADRSVLLQQRVSVQLSGEQARSAVGLIRVGRGWGILCPVERLGRWL